MNDLWWQSVFGVVVPYNGYRRDSLFPSKLRDGAIGRAKAYLSCEPRNLERNRSPRWMDTFGGYNKGKICASNGAVLLSQPEGSVGWADFDSH